MRKTIKDPFDFNHINFYFGQPGGERPRVLNQVRETKEEKSFGVEGDDEREANCIDQLAEVDELELMDELEGAAEDEELLDCSSKSETLDVSSVRKGNHRKNRMNYPCKKRTFKRLTNPAHHPFRNKRIESFATPKKIFKERKGVGMPIVMISV
ncbi:hypothetical protein L2E82_44841 [Cichorium intybus]|uniref:Uncharacterized protein n=1 Tax=Cichorium intybus TaxID=13427 RepID=A0ACB8ZRD2_CICIN|nr:hypothetical protein L2E82_44841 [Cichorium intybus]